MQPYNHSHSYTFLDEQRFGQHKFLTHTVTTAKEHLTISPSNDDIAPFDKIINDKQITQMHWLAKTKQSCLALCQQHNLATIEFAHWLAIPTLELLLVFRQQCCVAVEKGVL